MAKGEGSGLAEEVGTGVASVWRICCDGRGELDVVTYLVLQFLASWPTFLHLKHLPSFIHLACSWGVSFLSHTMSTSMALGSQGVRGVGAFWNPKPGWRVLLLNSLMRNFCPWKSCAFSIHPGRSSGGDAIDSIMVEICWSSPAENWVTVVSLSSSQALVARFSNLLMYS